MKTSEDIYKELLQKYLEIDDYNRFDMCKEFHRAMLTASLPSEEQVKKKSEEKYPTDFTCQYIYQQAMKDTIELLTKGE